MTQWWMVLLVALGPASLTGVVTYRIAFKHDRTASIDSQLEYAFKGMRELIGEGKEALIECREEVQRLTKMAAQTSADFAVAVEKQFDALEQQAIQAAIKIEEKATEAAQALAQED